jgi:tetratricopeptide (TPR) repeat protein
VVQSRHNNVSRFALGAAMVLMGGLGSGAALAECQPGQLQEANLAYQSASEFLVTRNWDQAIARLQSIIQVCPEHVEATRGIGTALLGKKDYEGAIPYFQKVIELRGDKVEAGDFANLAKPYAQLRQYKEARAEFMKAQRLAPDDCGVLYNLGVMHYAAEFHPQSVEVLEHALQVCPQIRDELLAQLSKSAEKAAAQQKRNGNMDKAAYYEGLTNKYGGQAGGSTTYDMVKQKMTDKDYAGAVILLDQMLEREPEHTGALLTLARAQDALKNRRASVAAYERYLAQKPDDAQATGSMIQVMVEASMASEAVERARQAATDLAGQGRENLAAVMYSWGLALEALGQYDGAAEKFQACATSGNPRYASSGRQQVERMEGLKAVRTAEDKKAAQGR